MSNDALVVWCDAAPLSSAFTVCIRPVIEFCLSCGKHFCERHWRVHDCARGEEKP